MEKLMSAVEWNKDPSLRALECEALQGDIAYLRTCASRHGMSSDLVAEYLALADRVEEKMRRLR